MAWTILSRIFVGRLVTRADHMSLQQQDVLNHGAPDTVPSELRSKNATQLTTGRCDPSLLWRTLIWASSLPVPNALARCRRR